MTISKKLINSFYLLFSAILIPTLAFAQVDAVTVADGAVFRGDFVVAGLGANGAFGAGDVTTPPAGFPSGLRGAAANGDQFGFHVDNNMDGFLTFSGEYFTPGTPEEGWGFEIDGTNFNNNRDNLLTDIVGGITGVSSDANLASVSYEAAAGGIQVNVIYSVSKNEQFIRMDTTLTNTTAADLNNIFFYRNVDPDNNQTLNGEFDTLNTIQIQGDGTSDSLAWVTAEQNGVGADPSDGSATSSILSYFSFDPRARVTHGGFDNRDASEIFEGLGDGDGDPQGSIVGVPEVGDVAISIAFDIGTIAPGESTNFTYFYNLNSTLQTPTLDEDSDNDGIPNFIEGGFDTDGDGIPDSLDLDSDNDGIPDSIEAGAGPDLNNDGVIDSIEDADGDDIPNLCDVDFTAGVDTTPGPDGIDDTCQGGVDTDGDGIQDSSDPDANGDGLVDTLDDETGGTFVDPVDTDGDGNPDFQDVDSDNDGIVDAIECPSLPCADTDGDSIFDYQDLDSDNDGLPDITEAGGNALDTNNNGIIDTVEDDDRDGVPNSCDLDLVANPVDTNPLDGIDDSCQTLGAPDADGDGIQDSSDPDADGDGFADVVDDDNNTVDGAGDGTGTPLNVPDTDGDGSPDFIDLDSDSDGVSDTVETGGTDANNDGLIDCEGTFLPNGFCSDVDVADGGIPLIPGDENQDGMLDFQDLPSFVLNSPFYFIWNGFLDQLNASVLFNKSSFETAAITIELYDIEGTRLSSQSFTLAPRSERDFLINLLDGFTTDTYGLVKVISTPRGIVDGLSTLYRSTPDGQDIEIGLIREHRNSIVGKSYATFNTFQPSQRSDQLNNVVIQWMQLANHSETLPEVFVIRRFTDLGVLIDERGTTVPPQGRLDLQVGHEDAIKNRIGLIEVEPLSPTALYGAEVFRYGGDSVEGISPTTYSYGLAERVSKGISGTQYVILSGAASDRNDLSILEVSNIGSAPETVTANIYNSSAELVDTRVFGLAPKQQSHLNVREFGLGADGLGYVEMIATGTEPILARSRVYRREASGEVTTAYTSNGREPIGTQGFSVQNTFFNQGNTVRLLNVTGGDSTLDVEVFDLNGVSLGISNVTIPANTAQELFLPELGFVLAPDSFGQVKLRVSSNSSADSIVADAVRQKRQSTDINKIDLEKVGEIR